MKAKLFIDINLHKHKTMKKAILKFLDNHRKVDYLSLEKSFPLTKKEMAAIVAELCEEGYLKVKEYRTQGGMKVPWKTVYRTNKQPFVQTTLFDEKL